MASSKLNQRFVIISGLFLILTTVFFWFMLSGKLDKTSERTVQDSWKSMQQVGQYDFSTSVEQITYPAPALANVGQSSTKEVYQISGQADLHKSTLNISLFKNQSSLLNQNNGVEIQIVEDKASGRAIGETEWKPIDNYSSTSFAFVNNSSSYLSSAKNIQFIGSKSVDIPQKDSLKTAVIVNRYRFDVDADRYALFMHDQMVQELQRSGKLPLGMDLSVSEQYRQMVSNGELWVNENGLPVRMIISMKMPPEKNGDHVEATITTDYFNLNTSNLLAVQPFPARMMGALGLLPSSTAAREMVLQLGVFSGSIFLMAGMVVFSKKKFAYGCVAFLVIFSMLVSPIWQGEKSAAFAKELTAQNASVEADKLKAQADKDASQSALSQSWDAHTNPLEKINSVLASDQSANVGRPLSPQQATLIDLYKASHASTTGENDVDTDHDGLTDAYENQYSVNVLNPNKADTDDDGLNDNVELKLNLYPGEKDTDGDGILDNDEVRSFYYGNKDWYLNPEERDTDLDGQIDSAECPERINGNSSGICRDTDGDLIPDVFDADDDNDGVPTIFDESPYVISNQVYSESNPLKLSVSNLDPEPVFVNYQLLPTNPKHLTYALNVLDWPSGDTDGQVQRVSNTTFADKMTVEQVDGDERSKYGDMRLIPMAEIKLTGDTYPLPLSRTASVEVNSDRYTGRFEFSSIEGNPGKTTIKLVSGEIPSKVIHVGQGSCDEVSLVSALNLHFVNDAVVVDKPLGDLVGGNYVLFLTDSSGASMDTCSSIPVVAHGKMSEYVIDSSILQAYGGAARNDVDGNVLLYAPLSVVYDETGGKPVALSTKVPFTNINGGFASSQQEIRIVWMINMLTDECKAIPADYDEAKSGTWCDASIPTRWNTDVSRVVHTYPDDFKLAGLSVVEDHGVNLAAIFENPATDTEPNYDDPLWGMESGLERTFMAGRSTDGENLDISVNEIQRRFDQNYNSDITDMNALWGFKKDTFRVMKYSYDNFDGVSKFMGSQVSDIFNNYFNSIPEASRPSSANLLIAREFNQRAKSIGEDSAACSASGCSVDFAGQDVFTQAMVNWAPYQRSGDKWQPYPLNDYLDNLEAHLRKLDDFKPADNSTDARNFVDGKIALAKIYYRNLFSGVSTLVAVNGTPVINRPVVLNDENVFSTFNVNNTKGKIVATVVSTVVNMIVDGLAKNPKLLSSIVLGTKIDAVTSLFKALGKGAAEKVSSITKLLTNNLRKVALGAAIFAAVSGLAVLAILYLNGDNSPAGMWAGRILYAVIGTVSAVLAGVALVGAIKAIKAVSESTKSAAIIGAVIGIAITWGVFFYSWGAAGVSFASIAFNNMLADAIAATVTIVLMAALASTGIGAIIVAVIGLIDGVIMSICALAGAYSLPESHWARQYICIGISGWITKIIKWTIYSNTYLIDYDNGGRLSFNKVDQDLQHVSAGMTYGNHMKISVGVTNTITKSSVPIDWKAALYFWQYSDANAKTSTFNYKVQSSEENIHSGLNRGDISGGWESVGKSKWKQEFTASTDGYSLAVPETGINQDPVAYVSEGSALPVQECWVIYYPILLPIPIPICYIRTERATVNSNISSSLTVDVFPSSLDGFYELAQVTDGSKGGSALAWGQKGDVKFPMLRDADGDGLLSKTFADGNDPDDTLFDTDGDGLGDFFEIAHGTNPRMVDTDDDGLTDDFEFKYMTSPTRKDTDGDGLTDFEEVQGWLYTYDFTSTGAPMETMVYSDPLMADTDLDGLTDYLEKVYGFNPRVAQNSDVLDYELTMREQDSPLVMLRFNENSGAMVFADSSNFGFSGSCSADECPLSGVDGRYAAAVRLDGTDLIHLPTTAKVLSLAGNRPFAVGAWVKTSTGGTLLSKWSDAEGGRQELRFEILDSHNLRLISSTATATSTDGVPSDSWSFVAASFDGSQVKFYIDGKVAGISSFSNSPSFAVDSQAAEMMVGAYQGASGPAGYFNGSVDELAYFDHELTEDDIANRWMTARYNFNDAFVRPGETVIYKSKITNLLNSRFAYGLLTTIIDKTEAIVDWASKLLPKTFVLYPDNPVVTGVNTAEIETTLQIEPAYTKSEDVTITQTAAAQIVDRRAESNFAELWLKLDDASGATVFSDESGTMPPRVAACINCPSSHMDGILNKAVYFYQGQSNAINLPDLSTLNLLNRGYTVSMWIKPENAANGARITLLKSDSNRLSINLVKQNGDSYMPEVLVNNQNKVGTSWRIMKTSVWSHLAVEYSTADNKVKVYINGGQIADVNASPLTSNANLVMGGDAAPVGFFVDDLRVFSRPLTTTDINRLAERPVLELSMDGANFGDTSVYGQSVAFMKNAPAQSSESVRGKSLNPGSGPSTGFLRVDGNSLLDMSDGSFTFSVWVYPTPQANLAWQGVFGYRDSNTDGMAYPSLERSGLKLRFGYGDGFTYQQHETANILSQNRWNHVAVTFEPSLFEPGRYVFKLYVDSVLKESKSFTSKPVSTSSFYVGASSKSFTTSLFRLNMDDEHDAGSHAEPYIREYTNGTHTATPMGETSMADGEHYDVNYSKKFSNFESVNYTVWEEDDSSADDNCGSFTRNWYDLPDANVQTLGLSDGFDGSLTFQMTRPSIPLTGYIDEIQVYRYALDSEQVYDLFYANPVTARMPMDDRPASTSFENSAVVGVQDDGTCSGANCPAAGTIGLINQAVRFDGVDDVISVPVITTSNYMMSLWINSTCGDCGVYSLKNGTNVYHQIYLKSGNVCSLVGSSEMCSQGGGIIDGQWHYVVYSNNAGVADLWLDGAKINSLSGMGTVSSPGTTVQLGYAPSAGKPTLNGQLDDVRVFRYAQDASVIAAIKQRAPIFLAHLDEPDGSQVFDDATPNNFQLVCQADACPTGGFEGRLRKAVEFNQNGDGLSLKQPLLSGSATAFTESLWIYPTQSKDATQTIFSIANGLNSQPRYAVSIAPNSMYLTVQNAQSIPLADIKQSNVELIKNTWNMITLVVERNADNNGEYYSLYINGYQDSTWFGTTYSTGLGKLTLGNSSGFGGMQSGPFTGKVDEAATYEYALNEIDIRESFAYQMGQVEETSSLKMTIDADAPSVSLASYNAAFPYVNENDRVLQVEASDATSGIGMVEMQVSHVNAPAPKWTVAPVCQDAPGGTAFCPTFIPENGEGLYGLSFRGVDQVGNQTVSPTYNFYVDKGAPKIFVNLQNGSLYNAQLHSTLENTWYLHMQGQVLDDTLNQGTPGSGLDLNSVKVTVYSENGEVAGMGEQSPQLTLVANGYDWNLDYLFSESEPTGALTVVIHAKDKVENQAVKTIHILLDASPVNAKMESNQVKVFDSGSVLDAGTLDGKLISSGFVSGKANDEPKDDTPYMTAAGKAASSGVARVQTAFEPSLDVSTLYNEPYPKGLLAWLPLDNTKLPEDAAGNPDESAAERYFLDVSPYQFAGKCSGSNCPINGETGHARGSIYFNGNENSINLGQNVDLANRSFSVSIWARRDAAGHSDPILWQGPLSMASQRFLFGLDYNDHLVCGFGGTDLSSTVAYPDTDWHSYSCTFDKSSGKRTLYRDGQETASDAAVPVPVMNENLFIGAAPVGSFAGSLDELMIFDRALTLDEIREQYSGYQDVYHLTVDDKFLSGGAMVGDASGYFHNGMLMTGSGDLINKVTDGAVGNFALHFDGNDRLAIEPTFSLVLDRGVFTQTAWVKPTAGSGKGAILSEYDENPEQRYPSIYLTEKNGLIAGFGDLYNWHEFSTADDVVQPGSWNFVAARFDGSQYSLLVNGKVVAQTNALAGIKPYPSERFNVGEGFVGDIDDVKIYTRALSDLEIAAMSHSGWREAQLSPAGGDTDWSAPVLPDLEGPYRVDVRGWDQFNHFDTGWNVNHQWSGVVDTLAPRFTFERTMDAMDPNLAHYKFSVEDTLLDEKSIHQNLCDTMDITREYFNSSWYLATGVPPNSTLYKLTGSCSSDIRTRVTTGFYACDLAGNCVMQEYPPFLDKNIYLPVILGGGAPGVTSLTPSIPAKLSSDQVERAMQWATLSESFHKVDGGQIPQIEISTRELAQADARSMFHANLRGVVKGGSGFSTLQVEILQNGAVIFKTTAAVYDGQWNAAWVYAPGGQPANGTYTVRVMAWDAAGQQTSVERDVYVHLLP